MGECKITVDQSNKLVKAVWNGKFELKEFEEGINATLAALKKFYKGESLYIGDAVNLDMRFLTPEMGKLTNDLTVFMNSHCKKSAAVVSSFVFQKSLDGVVDDKAKNRTFATEHEAMKWLMEK